MIPATVTEVTADVIVKAEPGMLVSILLTGGSDAATLVLYDHASAASGDKLCTVKTTTNVPSVTWNPPQPVSFRNGIYADISGTSPTAYIVFV